MKNIIITFIGAIISWYIFYAHKSDAKKEQNTWEMKLIQNY